MSKTKSKFGYILLGLLLITIGVCFVVFKETLTALAISIGVILSAIAIIYGTLTIAKKDRSARFAMKIIFSIICLVCGITTAIFNDNAVEVMVAVFSLILIVDGSFKLNTAAMSKRYSVGGWWVMLITSTLIILSAFILSKYTPQNVSDSSLWLGITIVVDGLANIFSAYWTAKYEKAERNEIHGEIKAEEETKKAEEEEKEAKKEKKSRKFFSFKKNSPKTEEEQTKEASE